MNKSWVLFDVGTHSLGIQTQHVRECVVLGRTEKVVTVPPHYRGLINLRGSILPILDLRKYFGLRSLADERDSLLEMLRMRKEDHLRWVTELRASVVERRAFTLTTDPHQCAFGKWYDSFLPPNAVLGIKMLSFDLPHQRIHAVGTQVQELLAQRRYEDAIALIDEKAAEDLNALLALFDETLPLFAKTTKEVVLVTDCDKRKVGIAVDSVSEVREIPPVQIEPLTGLQASGEDGSLFRGVAKLGKEKKILLDLRQLLGSRACLAQAASF